MHKLSLVKLSNPWIFARWIMIINATAISPPPADPATHLVFQPLLIAVGVYAAVTALVASVFIACFSEVLN